MSFLASVAMARAGSLLNDSNQASYTNTVLLPHIKSAAQIVDSKMRLNDLPYTEDSDTTFDFAAGFTALTPGSSPALPADFISPIELFEKPDGAANDQYVEIEEVDNLPFRQQTTELLEWTYKEGEIRFVGATVATDVLMRYERKVLTIASESTVIYLDDIELFLAAQTAAFAALIIGGNETLSRANQSLADIELEKFIANRVKDMQNLPARRKPYGYGRRMRRRA